MSASVKELMHDLEPPFCYYAYVIKDEGDIDYFHYGIWEAKTESFKEAQENLAGLVRSLIPKGVNRILDVGCGLGTTTRDLKNLGYEVVGISPDENLMKTARSKHTEAHLNLVTIPFERYQANDNFDLILFEESSQYINLQRVFSRCNKLLGDNGYVLICDEIKYSDAEQAIFHKKREILLIADMYGFEILYNKNITDVALPTRAFVTRKLMDNRQRIVSELGDKRRNVEEELDGLINGWSEFTRMFENGSCGYELFLFRKRVDAKDVLSKCRSTVLKSLYFLVSNTGKALKRCRGLFSSR